MNKQVYIVDALTQEYYCQQRHLRNVDLNIKPIYYDYWSENKDEAWDFKHYFGAVIQLECLDLSESGKRKPTIVEY